MIVLPEFFAEIAEAVEAYLGCYLGYGQIFGQKQVPGLFKPVAAYIILKTVPIGFMKQTAKIAVVET